MFINTSLKAVVFTLIFVHVKFISCEVENAERTANSYREKGWRVRRLKRPEQVGDWEECVEEHYVAQKERKRRLLENDAARVTVVSPYALTGKETHEEKVRTCKQKNFKDHLKSNRVRRKRQAENVTSSAQDGVATTASVKAAERLSGKGNGTAERRSDYVFSSVEYYEEQIEFQSDCKDMVMIDLEIEDLQAYDVECLAMVEWRSMDN